MTGRFGRDKKISRIASNRMVYALILVAAIVFAWTSGERMAYTAAIVFFALPICSYIITFIMLKGLRVEQTVPTSIIKLQPGVLMVRLHNMTPVLFGNVRCVFYVNKYAVETVEDHFFNLSPFKPTIAQVPFRVLYMGRYQIGLQSVQATDVMGLFRLQRRYSKRVTIIATPRILDISNLPLVMDLLAQASSRFDIRDEDYATIAEVRQYLPTDSVKRVHWKLTAKRNEWLVKVFQANALNCVTVIVDNTRMSIFERERYILEDQIIENAIALVRFCLNKGMPIDFMVTDGSKVQAQTTAGFNSIYNMTGDIVFEERPVLNIVSMLTHVLNEASGYVNTVIFTPTLNIELYERIVNATNKGHYAAVVYFAGKVPFRESERIYSLLVQGGLPCFRMTLEEGFDAT